MRTLPVGSPSAISPLPTPWLHAWPADGLEIVGECPTCSSTTRTLCHEDLIDTSFRVAPGRWRLWRCVQCGAAYLDPRPTAATVHIAYERYYTHHAQVPPVPSAVQRVRCWLTNGYANCRYGSKRVPATPLGTLAARLVPLLGTIADRDFRHLPASAGGARRLLDVGCGDGAFLAEARDCGWQVLGLEPDRKAAAVARQRGLEVRIGGLECVKAQTGAFDVITLSHVLEHLPNPVQALRDCWRLLRPGGKLWLETPNVDSLGHQLFGENWRGLEAPRHFVLFSPRALERALASAGFSPPRSMPSPSPRRWIFERSLAIAQGRLPEDVHPLPWSMLLRVIGADLRELSDSPTREFLTVVAARN